MGKRRVGEEEGEDEMGGGREEIRKMPRVI
jgi:hypothetical protein